ncbi:hypothetical protein EIP86_002042 [Pleurotus ostreatoroseus]|nr:hypothetical protein EIP86_002042 [Pleurotus ostreatoroseus]
METVVDAHVADIPPVIRAFKNQNTSAAAVKPARTLVLCFDGTGDQFDTDNSNIIEFFTLLEKGNRAEQMVYYQAGIGTYTIPQVATPMMAKVEKTLDEMIAWNLNAHVMGGYEFLMQNYEAGDKICIFGFSRGAYTARALAGMVHKVGLIPACNHQQVPFAYKMFTRTDELGWKQSTAFKKAFSIDVDIEFVGVWDTVSSVGLIPRTLPFTASNTSIKTFRHAVSLDEHRAKFKANLFNRPQQFEERLGTQPGDMPNPEDSVKSRLEDVANTVLKDLRLEGSEDANGKAKQTQAVLQAKPKRKPRGKHITDILEVWFAGCHCGKPYPMNYAAAELTIVCVADVGGGSVPSDTPHSLARIPLRWMIRQCFLADTGIRFHAELLRGVGLDPCRFYPSVLERPPPISSSPNVTMPSPPESTSWFGSWFGSSSNSPKTLVNYANVRPGYLTEEEEDLADALSPMYDQLALAPFWWILEWLPMRHKVQRADNNFNMGRARSIPESHKKGKLNVHRSVKLREEAEGLAGGPYRHRVEFWTEPTWAD